MSTVAEPTLQDLAETANSKHREVLAAARATLDAAIAAGEALIAAKNQLAHGKWEHWIEDNVEFSRATVWNYMIVARHKHKIWAAEGVESMRTAIAYLRSEKLTQRSRIDDDMVADIRGFAEVCGVAEAARLLGVNESTARRYATDPDRSPRVTKAQTSRIGKVSIDDDMIERFAAWLVRRLGKGTLTVDDRVRRLAVEGLQIALGIEGGEVS